MSKSIFIYKFPILGNPEKRREEQSHHQQLPGSVPLKGVLNFYLTEQKLFPNRLADQMATDKLQTSNVALKFIWILYFADAAARLTACTVTVTQPQSLEANIAESNITIPCFFSAKGCAGSPPIILWFRYLAHTHEDLCMPECTNKQKFQATSTVPESQASLRINDIIVGDSAIYFCGVAFPDSAAPTSKQTGEGTALTIRENKRYSRGVYIMTAISVLLFVYITAIFARFKFFSKPKTKETERGGQSTGSKGSKQSISRAIAQELRKKKNKMNHRPKWSLEKDNIYQNK